MTEENFIVLVGLGKPAGENIEKGDVIVFRDGLWWRAAHPPPKTREQVLEDALREMVSKYEAPKDAIENNFVIHHCLELARRALEWKS